MARAGAGMRMKAIPTPKMILVARKAHGPLVNACTMLVAIIKDVPTARHIFLPHLSLTYPAGMSAQRPPMEMAAMIKPRILVLTRSTRSSLKAGIARRPFIKDPSKPFAVAEENTRRMPMLSLLSPGSRYQDAWQLLGRFLYTSSPPELPAGPDTMLAMLSS